MAREFKLPDIGEGITEVELLQWYVTEGEAVREDQNLAEVETDKAVADLPSPYTAMVARLHFQPGDLIPVGAVLVTFDEQKSASGPPTDVRAEAPVNRPAEGRSAATAMTTGTGSAQRQTPVQAGPGTGRILAAPATRRRARELGVDLAAVQGSGPGGRVTPEDVERLARNGPQRAAAEQVSPPAHEASPTEAGPPRSLELGEPERPSLPDFARWGPVQRVALSATRRQIARKMAHSLSVAPHAAALDEVDVTELEALRRRAQERLQGRQAHLTLLPFVMKAAAAALKQFPALNASLDDVTQELVLKRYYHFGVAVDTERGLVVPVIRDVDRKTILELAVELAEMVQRTRTGKIDLEELRGGTFTITNAGAVGGNAFIPIINYPEVAILGIGRAQRKPVVREESIVARTMLPLSLAFDHRVVDGADVIRFMTSLMHVLEDPLQMLIGV